MSDKALTVVMPFLNEGKEPRLTAESILATSTPGFVEVIAVDDCSDEGKSPDMSGLQNVHYIKNTRRLGVSGCRDLGVAAAGAPLILIIDGHMRFKNDNWATKIVEALTRDPETAICTTSLGLGWRGGSHNKKQNPVDVNKPNGRYYAGTTTLRGERGRSRVKILEAKWGTKARVPPDGEIACILGANYGFDKQWYQKIRGFSGLMMYGSSEPFVSMKSWFAGGRCRILTDVEIGHFYRPRHPYTVKFDWIYYNKMRIAESILPEDVANSLIEEVTKLSKAARRLFDMDRQKIRKEREYYMSIFKPGAFDEYCRRFKIEGYKHFRKG